MKKELLLIIIFLIFISGCEENLNQEPVCGNGIHEIGEGYANCCEDSGCPFGKTCVNSKCTTETNCNQCQYKEGGICKNYVCCIDIDCDDNNQNTSDECLNGFTKQAECKYTIENYCIDNDSLCPEECNITNDSDCEPDILNCGNATMIMLEDLTFDLDQGGYDCFITSSQNCDSAILRINGGGVFLGVNSTTKTRYELKGTDDSGKCIFYILNEYVSLFYTDGLIESLLNANYTQEEINEMEQEIQDGVEKSIGNEGTCFFNIDDLTATLSRWKNGEISTGVNCPLSPTGGINCTPTGDWELGNCSGNYWGSS